MRRAVVALLLSLSGAHAWEGGPELVPAPGAAPSTATLQGAYDNSAQPASIAVATDDDLNIDLAIDGEFRVRNELGDSMVEVVGNAENGETVIAGTGQVTIPFSIYDGTRDFTVRNDFTGVVFINAQTSGLTLRSPTKVDLHYQSTFKVYGVDAPNGSPVLAMEVTTGDTIFANGLRLDTGGTGSAAQIDFPGQAGNSTGRLEIADTLVPGVFNGFLFSTADNPGSGASAPAMFIASGSARGYGNFFVDYLGTGSQAQINFAGAASNSTLHIKVNNASPSFTYQSLIFRGPASPASGASVDMVEMATDTCRMFKNSEVRGFLGEHTTEQAITITAAATTFNVTQSNVRVSADAAGNAVATITCTGCVTGSRLTIRSAGAGTSFTLVDDPSPVAANALALSAGCDLTSVDSMIELYRTPGGYWAQVGPCNPN